MEGSILVFCTARPEEVSRAVNAVLKDDSSARTVSYAGPENSPFAKVADRFYSWGKGPFNFWKAFRLCSRIDRDSNRTVILPLNRGDGRGYFALRLFARCAGKECAREVTPGGEVRSINVRRFLDTYRIEETLLGAFISVFRFCKPLLAVWLKPVRETARTVSVKGRELSYTLLREFEPDETPIASVIIRTYNEERFLAKTLKMIFAQKGVPREVVVIDSESTDATAEIARAFPVRLVKIKKECFSYGAALNLGARLARGRYVVNLSAHAIPAGETWLAELIEPLKNTGIAGVHGAERPMEGHCGLLERKILVDSFPDVPAERWDDSFFSNANSAMRRELVLDHPFDESADWAEDRLWAGQMQELGYKTAYRPQAGVYHSHNLSARGNFKRSFRFFAMQFGSFYKDRANDIRNGYLADLPSRAVAFRRFLSDGNLASLPWSLAYAPFCEFVNYLGCEFAWEQWNGACREKPTAVPEPQNQVAL